MERVLCISHIFSTIKIFYHLYPLIQLKSSTFFSFWFGLWRSISLFRCPPLNQKHTHTYTTFRLFSRQIPKKKNIKTSCKSKTQTTTVMALSSSISSTSSNGVFSNTLSRSHIKLSTFFLPSSTRPSLSSFPRSFIFCYI